MFGSGATVAGARPRPHRLPAHARRQPAGVQRLAHDRARRARAPAGDPRARRQGRRRRPAPHAHRQARPTSTSSSAPAPTRCCCFALVHVIFDEGLASPAAGRRTSRASTRSASWPRDFTPEAVAAATRHRRAETIRRMARELAAAPTRRGLRPDRHDDAALRHDGELARRRAQRDHRQPRPPGRRDVPAPATARRTRAASPGAARGAAFGRWHSRVRGLGEVFGELPVACLAEEIETPGRGPGPRAASRSPATRWSRTPNADAPRPRRSSALDFMVSVDIYVNETTRHADVILPGAVAAGALALRPRALRLRGAQRGELLAAGAGARPRRAARVGDAAAPHRRRRRPGADADVAALDDFVALETARRQTADAHSPVHGREPEELLADSSRARARAAARPDAARRALRADARRPRGRAARHRPRAARAAAARGAAHAERARSSSRPRRSSPTSRACARRWPSRQRRAWCSSAAATCARTTRGCTTCRCSSAARQRCTAHVHPDDAARLGLADGEPAA